MVWKRCGQQIVAQKMENEAVVADLRTGVYHSISGSGALIWDAIDRGHSRQQIIGLLAEAFESTPDELDNQLTRFIDQLVADDLIKPSEAPPSALPRDKNFVEKRPFEVPTLSRYRSSDQAFSSKAGSLSWQVGSPFVVAKLVDNDLTILHAQKGIICRVFGCGALIWQGIENELSKEKIVESLVANFETSADIAGRELNEFVAQLANHSLIQPRDAASKAAEATNTCTPTETQRDCPSEARKPFAPPVMSVDYGKHEALKQITSLNGWQITEPQIVSETIDDEVIVVDLQEGVYHSITGAGMLIWEALTHAYARNQIVDLLQSRYEISSEQAENELDDFVEKLAEFNLIRPRQARPDPGIPDRPDPTTSEILTNQAVKEPFAPPVMTIYKDMESVLRLDPIHDFDEFGWPAKV